MLPAGRGRGFCGQIGTTGTSGNRDSDVMLPAGRGGVAFEAKLAAQAHPGMA